MQRNIRFGLLIILISALTVICAACGRTPVLPSKMYDDWKIATVNEQSYSDFARENKLSSSSVKWTLQEKFLLARYSGSDSTSQFPIIYNKYGFEVLSPDYSIFASVYYDKESDTLSYEIKEGEEICKYTLERIKA